LHRGVYFELPMAAIAPYLCLLVRWSDSKILCKICPAFSKSSNENLWKNLRCSRPNSDVRACLKDIQRLFLQKVKMF